MRKLYMFRFCCANSYFFCDAMYYTKDGKWSMKKEDALIVDDWAVEFYMEGKFAEFASTVKLVEVG